jgi:hypothetical protein
MANRNKLPSTDVSETVHIMGRTIEAERPEMTTQTTAVIELPLSSISTTGYVSKRADVKLTRKQCLTLRAVLRGLEDRGAVLENGRPVNNVTQAVQYILEEIANSAEKPLFG